MPAGKCTTEITTASECFSAVKSTFKSVNVHTQQGTDASQPLGCSVKTGDVGAIAAYFNTGASGAGCGEGVSTLTGMAIDELVGVMLGLRLDTKTEKAQITMTGPSSQWFGVGFNASAMKDSPWAIVVDGNGKVTEHKLKDQGAPPTTTALPASIKMISNEVKSGIRTVVLSRPFKGLNDDYYSFTTEDSILPYISAVGTGATLAYHKQKGPNILSILPEEGSGSCVCEGKPIPFGQAKGSFTYNANKSQAADVGSGTVNFGNNCAPQPRMDTLAQHNPTCDPRTYVGGQLTCHHMWSLLDADQDIPWADQPLEYVQKFRFYYQEYNASYHKSLKRTTWGIASPVEYDVPKCEKGMMGCEQTPDGNWVHTITGTFHVPDVNLAAGHFHCHAPTCLSVSMYNNKTGELICRQDPLYGGTGVIANKDMDEPGFIAQPPCLWGSKEHGLEAPYSGGADGIDIHVVKTANATYGHHGEMAWLQMYYY